ncbi:hypothetical protein A0J61_09816 [Choanephora cucurbitarum]|uniref:Uncharacterized protein n=1 Tax=Choanephora cucurbitarum TaxID=101091 RepID=A0A1C7MZ93_9FUNG|nr:hypothetical protein A0J61_09816 [Choanephora cucurbitarum]
MTSYWYCTDGIKQCLLPNHHISSLDNAFQTHIRIQITEAIFERQGIALADPSQGTLTMDGLHFGLYRHPPIQRTTSFESLIFMDHSQTMHSDLTLGLEDEELTNQFTWMIKKEQSSHSLSSPRTCCIIS